MATYEIWLTDDRGLRLRQLDDVLALEAGRSVNAIGALSLAVRPTFPETFLQRDHMVQVWRAPAGGRLGLWRPYFIRWWKFGQKKAQELLTLGGPDANDLLRRRIVAAYADSSQADKTDYADDMMKEVVSESQSDAADPTPDAGTRTWANFSVAGDLGDGPTLTKGFAFKKLLTSSGGGVLPAIARAAREAGTEVFFDVQVAAVSSSSISFVFRTFTGQPGADRTSTAFSVERGNLRDPSLLFDYREEENYIYGAGLGGEEDRTVEQAYDAARYGASAWNRCEGSADARDQGAADGVREAARAALHEGRGRVVFTATPLDVKGTRFGVHWEFGDLVRARYRNQEFDAIVRGVVLKVDSDGAESVGARLDYEGAV